MIDLSFVIITMLVLEISMVFWIFRWALKAIDKIRTSLIQTLMDDTPEREAIVSTIAKQIWIKLNGMLNLNQIDRTPENIGSLLRGASESPDELLPTSLLSLGKSVGIDDPGFLKYLPLIQQFLSKKETPKGNIGGSDDSW